MPKRAHTDDDEAPAKFTRKETSSINDRRGELKGSLHNLNKQYARWVREQEAEHLGEVWVDGAKDYINYMEEILKEYKDVIDAEIGKGNATQQTLPAPAAATTTSGFVAFGRNNAASSAAAATSTAGATPSFAFGAAAGAADSASKPSPFGGAPAAAGSKPASPFMFGTSSSTPAADITPAASKPVFGFAAGSTPAAESSQAAASSTPAAGFSFGAASSAAATAAASSGTTMFGSSPSTAAGANGFSFGAASAAASAPAAGSAFKFGATSAAGSAAAADSTSAAAAATSSAPATASFLFGTASTAAAGTTATTTTAFPAFGGFGSTSAPSATTAAPAFAGFGSFGSSNPFLAPQKPAADGEQAAAGTADGEDDAEELPPEESAVPKEDTDTYDILFKKECKLFRKVGADWKVMGKGPVTIRRDKTRPSAAPLVMVHTGVAKCMLAAWLYVGMSVKIGSSGKQVQTILHFAPGDQEAAPPVSEGEKAKPVPVERHHVLFSFGKPESAQELAAALREHIPQQK